MLICILLPRPGCLVWSFERLQASWKKDLRHPLHVMAAETIMIACYNRKSTHAWSHFDITCIRIAVVCSKELPRCTRFLPFTTMKN